MRTRFELVLHGDSERALLAAGEEALEEITETERQLSSFRSDSWVRLLNREAGRRAVSVPPSLIEVLRVCAEVHRESGGAFDPTVAPLLRSWGLRDAPACPTELPMQLEEVGFDRIEIDARAGTVRFPTPRMEIDLGGIGKGIALDRAAAVLRDCGVSVALLHGGTSTILALAPPPRQRSWRVSVRHPERADELLASVPLAHGALSVSAPRGRQAEVDGVRIGHVLDPRDGRPARAAELAVVRAESATAADAWSTALLVQAPGRRVWRRCA